MSPKHKPKKPIKLQELLEQVEALPKNTQLKIIIKIAGDNCIVPCSSTQTMFDRDEFGTFKNYFCLVGEMSDGRLVEVNV